MNKSNAILAMILWLFMMVDPIHPQLLENIVVILFQLFWHLQGTRCLYISILMIMMMATADSKLNISQVHMVKSNFLFSCDLSLIFKNAKAKLVNSNPDPHFVLTEHVIVIISNKKWKNPKHIEKRKVNLILRNKQNYC